MRYIINDKFNHNNSSYIEFSIESIIQIVIDKLI